MLFVLLLFSIIFFAYVSFFQSSLLYSFQVASIENVSSRLWAIHNVPIKNLTTASIKVSRGIFSADWAKYELDMKNDQIKFIANYRDKYFFRKKKLNIFVIKFLIVQQFNEQISIEWKKNENSIRWIYTHLRSFCVWVEWMAAIVHYCKCESFFSFELVLTFILFINCAVFRGTTRFTSSLSFFFSRQIFHFKLSGSFFILKKSEIIEHKLIFTVRKSIPLKYIENIVLFNFAFHFVTVWLKHQFSIASSILDLKKGRHSHDHLNTKKTHV